MFQVKNGEKEYRVRFFHLRPFMDGQGITRCDIDNDEQEVTISGLAFCSPHDRFSRKVALASALEHYDFDRETLALFWMKYYQARGGKW